ncbi:uroporphyrinogen decarboxylase [Candidatus Methylomirabilis lanthanidiphila]|uniref:Uroporphyrinogen decarboxylase n=1 Tax=Candidatus Methylomirabilis lanthanidiphila TaxID=2211376 RepID=A0A564ZM54_9BACT|nr:uroporphyrinogen decarboxylase [Candidatus Methylomirabilis lanthanidiphila]
MNQAIALSSAGLSGLTVVSFESRLAAPMADLISRQGGTPVSAPALREIPCTGHAEAIEFTKALLDGRIDMVVWLTGVGARALLAAVEDVVSRTEFLAALSRIPSIALGPKPQAVLRELGIPITLAVPEPNTWREVLTVIDSAAIPLLGRRVAVQEYGRSNPELIAGLEARGADVVRVPVYQWALPEDCGPLRQAIKAIVDRQVDLVLFTTAVQADHLLQVAAAAGLEEPLRAGLHDSVVASIGPTCSKALREHGLTVDLEPEHSKMGHLVQTAARHAQVLRRIKRARTVEAVASRRQEAGSTDVLRESAFMKACRLEPAPYTPIWIMRQAGRYLQEYREIRGKLSFLELCHRPDLAAEVTVTAAERLGVDAAIIFGDILLVVEPMGVGLEFTKGDGPVIHHPVRCGADLKRLRPVDIQGSLSFLFEAVRLARAALPPNIPLIGFAGAPFTLASYLIEGRGSRQYQQIKTLMYRDPAAWHALMERLSDIVSDYLNGQIAAGVQVVQLFDSWVGCLSPDDYREFVLPHTKRAIAKLAPGVPVIHFGTDTTSLLPLIREAGGNVIGLDWRVDLGEAWAGLGYNVGVQGNLDPVALFAEPDKIRRLANRILDRAAKRPGHIFNLGHGILPQTPVDHLRVLIDHVREATVR